IPQAGGDGCQPFVLPDLYSPGLSMFFYLRICYVVGLYFNHNRQNGQQVSISIILAFLFCLGYYINAKGGVSQC
uniref:hypothetical protein n=1 Tax=Gemmiger formicilis TaxID=745368 RepID=UPI0040255BAB